MSEQERDELMRLDEYLHAVLDGPDAEPQDAERLARVEAALRLLRPPADLRPLRRGRRLQRAS